jgi:hypothetical protein
MSDTPVSSYPESGFVVELERFQGPLDLLLHLIREQDIDIFDIPIAQITAQFLAVMAGVERLGLDRAGEFLEMAALLVRIKVQMLLPRRTDGEGALEDPRAGWSACSSTSITGKRPCGWRKPSGQGHGSMRAATCRRVRPRWFPRCRSS